MTCETSFYSRLELEQLGLRTCGDNVKISRFARFYNPSMIVIGNNVRIDDFTIISAGKGGIHIGNYVHIPPTCLISGEEKITFEDFSGLSSRASVYSSTDSFTGPVLAHPTIPVKYREVFSREIVFRRHCIVGSGSVVLPGAVFGEGTAIGALSLVKIHLEPWTVYGGNPLKELGPRSKNTQMEKEFLSTLE